MKFQLARRSPRSPMFFFQGASRVHGFLHGSVSQLCHMCCLQGLLHLPVKTSACKTSCSCFLTPSFHLKGSHSLTPRLFQNKTITHRAHTGCRSFVTSQALTIASSCLFGTFREYFLNPSHFSKSRTVD